MNKSGIEVEGLKETTRNLKNLGVEAADLKDASFQAGQIITATAKTLAPIRTGALANSTRAGKTVNGVVVKAGGNKVPYAAVIHFGHAARNIEPQPFLYDAVDKRRGEVIAAYQKGLEKAIKNAGLENKTN